MNRRSVLASFAAIVALSLVGAPVTMADWGEQASFSTERIGEAEAGKEAPLLQYESLPESAQGTVRRAIDAPDGDYTVYGREDWPDRFFYSDYAAPGQGLYTLVHQDRYYRLYTYAGGGFPFVYWLYELPFIVYGLLLGWIASETYRGRIAARSAALAAVPGIGFHLLGPEFDFPLLAPMEFVALGTLATIVAVIGFCWTGRPLGIGRKAD